MNRESTLEDINNFDGRLESQISRVQDLDSSEDRDNIIRWVLGMDVATSTKIGRVNCIRLLAERAPKPLHEFEDDGDVSRLLAAFRDGSHPDIKNSGLSEGSLRQYRQAARLFFRDQLDRDWGENIDIGQPERSPVTPDMILTGEELDALLDTADARTAAFIAFLAVTGQRRTAALSIRLGDVDLSHQNGTIRLNDDAEGLKGASGPRPLLWSRPYIARWLEEHPLHPGNPDEPLFCCTQSGRRPHQSGEGFIEWHTGDPLSPHQAQKRVREVADEAGVPREKVKLHNFRHTAITRMRDQGVSDDRIKFMVGVDPRSDILERYDHADNEKMMARIRESHGIQSDETVGRPSLESCPQCMAPLRGSARYCGSCGMPMDVEAADELQSVQDSVTDRGFNTDDVDERALSRALMDALQNSPELRGEVLDRL